MLADSMFYDNFDHCMNSSSGDQVLIMQPFSTKFFPHVYTHIIRVYSSICHHPVFSDFLHSVMKHRTPSLLPLVCMRSLVIGFFLPWPSITYTEVTKMKTSFFSPSNLVSPSLNCANFLIVMMYFLRYYFFEVVIFYVDNHHIVVLYFR